jgi:hypothetical protein
VAAGISNLVYIGEEGFGRVGVYDAALNYLYALGRTNNEFQIPGFIAVDLAQTNTPTLYVSDGRTNCIKKFTTKTLSQVIGSKGIGPGQFDFPAGICVGTNGNLFVVDQNNDRVQVFSPAGVFSNLFPLATPLDSSAISGRSYGIASDRSGRIYIADAFQGQVKVFDYQGNFLSLIGSFGDWVGQLRTPAGVTVDASGRLYVAAVNNSRVEIYGLDSFAQLAVTPASQVLTPGTNAIFSASVGNAGPFTFQWMNGTNVLSDGPKYSGTTTTNLTVIGASPADAGTYTFVVSGPAGPAASASGELTAPAQAGVTLQVVSEHGVAEPPVGLYTNNSGMSVECRVSGVEMAGATQYVCAGWTLTGQSDTGGFGSGSGTNVSLTHTSNAVLVWQWQTQYWLSAVADTHGSVAPSNGWWDAGSTATVTATADAYYHFMQWTGSVSSAANPLFVPMDGAQDLGAAFGPDLAVNATPVWWLASFGLTNGNWDDLALADPDGDRMLTWQEWAADTDPTNPLSCVAFSVARQTAGGALIQWHGGVAATQYLERVQSLHDMAPQWTALFTNEPPTPVSTNYLDASGVPAPAFYRIRVSR